MSELRQITLAADVAELVAACRCKDDSRPILTGISIRQITHPTQGKMLEIAATDTHRLAVAKVHATEPMPPNGVYRIEHSKKVGGYRTWTMVEIGGEFPNYGRLIPDKLGQPVGTYKANGGPPPDSGRFLRVSQGLNINLNLLPTTGEWTIYSTGELRPFCLRSDKLSGDALYLLMPLNNA